jgi:hypothetical protein
MAYFRIVVNTPYCGTEQEEYIECETIQEAESIAEELCQNNAEGYEYLVSGWDDENFEGLSEEEQNEELEEYYSSCDWSVDEITEEEFLENS